ncbi:MAG: DUF4388 domain-containing protein [Verrucomicrobiota bacterium]
MTTGEKPLTGRLESFGMISITTICRLEKFTGLLTIESPAWGAAEVFFLEGEIVLAKTIGKVDLQDAEAMTEMLTWGEGSFALKELGPGKIPMGGKPVPCDEILKAAAQSLSQYI